MKEQLNFVKKKILLISLYTEFGGGEYALYNLLRHLDRDKFEPVLLTNTRGPLVEKTEALGVKTNLLTFQVTMLWQLIYPVKLLRLFRDIKCFHRYLQQNPVDIVHCQDVLSLLLVGYSKLSLRIPVLYNVIFFYEWTRIILFNILALLFVDKIIVHSKLIQDDLSIKTFFLKKQISVIPLGVDKATFRPRRTGETDIVRMEFAIDKNIKLVGMVGRIDPIKSQHIFLQAAFEILKQRNDLKFVMIGGSLNANVITPLKKYEEKIRALFDSLKLGEKVFLIDHRDDIPEVLRSFDVLVCPSQSEGFGMIILEALASGAKVIASRTVGVLDFVNDFPGVFIAEPNNPRSLVKKLNEALSYDRKIDADIIDKQLEKFSWQSYAKSMEREYLKLVK